MLAYVFPGQGSQQVGMGKELAASFPVARRTFEEADEILGFSLSRLCFDGPGAELDETVNAQPAILATSIAALRVLAEQTGLSPTIVAGHSLGDFTALVCAGALEFQSAVALVRIRAQWMQRAAPLGTGAMVAIIGLDSGAVEAICARAAEGEVLSIANYNGAGQHVVSGHAAAVARAARLAQEQGAVTRALNVSAPFHCALMAPAAEALALGFERFAFRAPQLALVDSVHGQVHMDARGLPELLAEQVRLPIRWEDSVKRLLALRVKRVVEVGWGGRLTRLLHRMAPELPVTAFATPAELERVAAIASELPLLKAPIGRWRLASSGDLYRDDGAEVIWADSGELERVDDERWAFNDNGTRIRRFGPMAVMSPEHVLQVYDPRDWYPREDGAFVRCDHTAVVLPTGRVERFDLAEWEISRTGAMLKKDGTRTIWPDGTEWERP